MNYTEMRTLFASRPYFPVIVRTKQQLNRMLEHFQKSEAFAWDTETVSVEDKTIVGFSIANSKIGYYVPLGHTETDEKQIPLWYFVHKMKPLLEDPTKEQIAHNGKFDLLVMNKLGIYPAGNEDDINYGAGTVHDTMILSWLQNVGKKLPSGAPVPNGLKERCDADCGIEMEHLSSILKRVKAEKKLRRMPTVDKVGVQRLGYYAALDAVATWKLWRKYRDEIEKTPKIAKHYYDAETKYLRVLHNMEQVGYRIDRRYLEEVRDQLDGMAEVTKKEIFRLVGFEFDILSTKDLSRVLFDVIGLPPIKKTAKGAPSCDAATLEALAKRFGSDPKSIKKYGDGVKALKEIVKYRNFVKMRSTYVQGVLDKLDGNDRIHTSFGRVETGRLSSSGPNLQNLPREESTPISMRQAFIAKPGYKLIVLDYSQLELRILAHFTRSENMIEAYRLGRDLHSHTASKIAGIEYDKFVKIVKDELHPKHAEYKALRTASKSITFGIIYGMGTKKLAESLKISEEEAEHFQKLFFKQYPEIQPLINDVHRFCRDNGYVVTYSKRRRYMPDIMHPDIWIARKAEREGFNTIIQGTAADIVEQAMIDLAYEVLPQFGARLLLQVHDELHVEVPEDVAEDCFKATMYAMENPRNILLRVSLTVEGHIADNWRMAK